MKTKFSAGVAIVAFLGFVAAELVPWAAHAADATPDQDKTDVAAESSLTVFVALRTWFAKQDIPYIDRIVVLPNPANPASAIVKDVVSPAVSDSRFLFLPSVGLRFGNLVASVSGIPSSEMKTPGAVVSSLDRQEVDVNVGYYVLPGLAISAGYKRAEIGSLASFTSTASSTIDAFLIGGSASAPLSDRLSLYGNFAYGYGHQKYSVTLADGESSVPGTYRIAELGLSYRVFDREGGKGLKGLSIQFGYRIQDYVTSAVLGTYAPAAPTVPLTAVKTDVRSVTDGLILGIVGVF